MIVGARNNMWLEGQCCQQLLRVGALWKRGFAVTSCEDVEPARLAQDLVTSGRQDLQVEEEIPWKDEEERNIDGVES